MKIQFCGASSGVTGSCHLITTEKHKILLDCGQFQGGKAQEALNYIVNRQLNLKLSCRQFQAVRIRDERL